MLTKEQLDKLAKIQKDIDQGMTNTEAHTKHGVSSAAYYSWRKQLPGYKPTRTSKKHLKARAIEAIQQVHQHQDRVLLLVTDRATAAKLMREFQ